MKYSIRDLLLVTAIVALALGWWVERSRMAGEIKELRKEALRLEYVEYAKQRGGPGPFPLSYY